MDPATATILAAGIAGLAKGGGDFFAGQSAKRQSKRKAKELKRETYAGLLGNTLERDSELEAHRLAMARDKARKRVNSMSDTANIVRGAVNI